MEKYAIDSKIVPKAEFEKLRSKLSLDRDEVISDGEMPRSAFSKFEKEMLKGAKSVKIFVCPAHEASDKDLTKPYFTYMEYDAKNLKAFCIGHTSR